MNETKGSVMAKFANSKFGSVFKNSLRMSFGVPAVAAVMLSTAAQPEAVAATACRDLALLRLPGTLITRAHEVSGSFSP
ncbi:MAG: hypothetical protein R3305_05045, partial [Gammaproteobacteria bacterium]|nr:hypothetical protein [Gammaproteobacteria bacterium]